jgi:hypothetical protein
VDCDLNRIPLYNKKLPFFQKNGGLYLVASQVFFMEISKGVLFPVKGSK